MNLKTRASILLAWSLVVLGLAIYATSFNNAFVLDDENQILNNPVITSPSNIGVFFAGSTMTQANLTALAGSYYKPLMTLCYSVLWWLTPGQPFLFHLFQFLIFALNSILVFFFLRHFLPEALAWFVAALYLVHPINAEVALYIADLQDALYTCFGLLALNVIANAETFSIAKTVGLGCLLMLGMLSKESGALYILMCPIYAGFYKRKVLKPVLAAAGAVTAAYLALRLGHAHLGPLAYEMNKIGRAPLGVRLMTAPYVLALYLYKFAFPAHFTTTQDWVVESFDLDQFWLPLAALAAVLAVSVWYARRCWRKGDTRFAFFTFWVFAGMGFHSHILVPLDGTFADRWFYFQCLGLLAMLAIVIENELPKIKLTSTPVKAGAMAVVGALAIRSHVRSADWVNNYVLCGHDVALLPESYDLHNNLGVELFRRGKIVEAQKEFIRSTELAPMWDVNWSNLGASYSRLGNQAKAEECYLHSMKNGAYFMAYENYAGMLVSEGRIGEAREFMERKALPRFPASVTLNTLYRTVINHSK